MGQRVAVVGGGYAGMAAAVTLAERGNAVTLFEAGPVLGGRARRIVSHGRELDNGQHIFIGAYTALFALMRKVGVADDALLRLPLEIRYAKGFAFRALWLPPPFGVLAGLLLARGVPFAERLGAVRFMNAMRKRGFRLSDDLSFDRLLDQFRQNGRIGHYLWRPVCVSALNTPVEQASANVFLAVLRDTLAGAREASDLLLPRLDLSRLFPEPAAEFVRARGGEIRLKHTVQHVEQLREDFSAVVVAVGPHQLKSLLPELAQEYSYQPIYTCYLQYGAHAKLEFPMLGLAAGLVQWVFDLGQLGGEKGRLACVISAQGEHQQRTQDEIAASCERELAQAFAGVGKPLWSRVIAEKRATITCAPGLKRPGPRTAIPNVYLAGDYTDAEYPPTLEAAVRSGVRAASQIAQ